MVDHKEQLRASDIVSTLMWLASFSIQPGKASMGRLVSKLETMLESCSTPELCNAFWSLALLGETGR